jgi:membrane protein required for colicin V production
MNWLDVVLLILVAGSVVTAIRKGLSRELIGFASVIAALLLSTWLYGTAGAYLIPYVSSKPIAHIIGFALVFLGVMLVGSLVGAIVKRVMRIAGLSLFDRALGGLFGFARGLVISIALVMIMMAFAPGSRKAVAHSRLAPYVVDAAGVCAAIAPYELKEGFRKSYDEVHTVWKDALKKGFRALPSKDKGQNEREI